MSALIEFSDLMDSMADRTNTLAYARSTLEAAAGYLHGIKLMLAGLYLTAERDSPLAQNICTVHHQVIDVLVFVELRLKQIKADEQSIEKTGANSADEQPVKSLH